MYKLPSPNRVDTRYSTQGQFRNPAATNPLPAPRDMPISFWAGSRQSLRFNPTSATDAVSEGSWASPIYDLQPQLRGMVPSGTFGSSQGNGLNAVPIWNGGNLFVQVNGLRSTPSSLENIAITAQEFGHITNAGAVVAINAVSDITSQFETQTDSVILQFSPAGGGNPVRFWRLVLRFRRTAPTVPATDDPVFAIEASYY